MESIFAALQWLGGVLKGLIEIISNSKINMFNRSTIYNIEKVEVNIDKLIIADKETADRFADMLKSEFVAVREAESVSAEPPITETP